MKEIWWANRILPVIGEKRLANFSNDLVSHLEYTNLNKLYA